jgi:prefoldin subunit 5
MARDADRDGSDGGIQRLERAIERAEQAADRLESRHRALRRAAEETVETLDRLIPANG